jgi:hypothetical protein
MLQEPISNYLGACAFRDHVCIITTTRVHVLSSNWVTKWISSSFKANKVVSATMNEMFVVIATDQEVVVFSQSGKRDRNPIIRQKGSVKSLQLLTGDNSNCLIVSHHDYKNKSTIYDITSLETEESGMFFVMDDVYNDSVLTLKRRKDFTLFDNHDEEVLCVREYSPGLIVQISNCTVCIQWEDGRIRRYSILSNMIVDVCVSSNGLVILHDSKNTIHIFNDEQPEIIKGDEICQAEYSLSVPMHEAIVSYKSITLDEINNRIIMLLPSGTLSIIQL